MLKRKKQEVQCRCINLFNPIPIFKKLFFAVPEDDGIESISILGWESGVNKVAFEELGVSSSPVT